MSFKLFNERIASAIDNHKDRKGWTSLDNDQFLQEIFSGSYNEKNLQQLKLFIKRHSQSFTWQENDTSFLVKRRIDANKKQSNGIASWCRRLFAWISSFFKQLFSIKKKPGTPKKRTPQKEKPVAENVARARQPRNKDHARQRDGARGKTRSGETRQKNATGRLEGNRASDSGDQRTNNTRSERKKTVKQPTTKQPSTKVQSRQRKKETTSRGEGQTHIPGITSFASFSPYEKYLEACTQLIPKLSDGELFVTFLDGNFDNPVINLPAYITATYRARYRTGDIVEGGEGAIFHTGLFTKEGDGIYMTFKKKNPSRESTDEETNKPARGRFHFNQFEVVDSPQTEEALKKRFGGRLPQLVSSLVNGSVALDELFFDASKSLLFPREDNFLLQNLFYLPEDILEHYSSLKGYKQQLAELKGTKRVEVMGKLAQSFAADSDAFRELQTMLFSSIRQAFDCAKRNPRIVYPVQATASGKWFMHLPIQLKGCDKWFFLVLESVGKEPYKFVSLSSMSKTLLALRATFSLGDSWLQDPTRR